MACTKPWAPSRHRRSQVEGCSPETLALGTRRLRLRVTGLQSGSRPPGLQIKSVFHSGPCSAVLRLPLKSAGPVPQPPTSALSSPSAGLCPRCHCWPLLSQLLASRTYSASAPFRSRYPEVPKPPTVSPLHTEFLLLGHLGSCLHPGQARDTPTASASWPSSPSVCRGRICYIHRLTPPSPPTSPKQSQHQLLCDGSPPHGSACQPSGTLLQGPSSCHVLSSPNPSWHLCYAVQSSDCHSLAE